MKTFLALTLSVGLISAIPYDRKTGLGNPEEGPYYQGDIILNEEQMRNGIIGNIDDHIRWPKVDGKVMVAYFIDEDTFPDSNYVTILQQKLDEWPGLTNGCINWIERTDEDDYVRFTGDAGGCFSYLGRQPTILQPQQVNYGRGCITSSNIETTHHEQLHAMGFYHMQSDQNRDNYVQIHYENVQNGYEGNFDKEITEDFGVSYDYYSIMHYPKDAFSKNGLNTIDTLDSQYEDVIGNRDYITDSDIEKLMSMYQC